MIDQWLTHISRQGRDAKTVHAYRRALGHFARWTQATYGEPFDPAATIPRDVADWQAHQQTVERASLNTVNQRLAGLRQFFAWAVECGHVTANPVQVTSRKPDRLRPRALDEADQRRLLRAVHKAGDPRDIALVELMLGTGLRVSEVLALRRADLTLNGRSGAVTVVYGKYGKTRTVPVPRNARAALGAYLEAANPAGSLWTGQRGPLRDKSAVNRLLGHYREAARIEAEVTPHILRHTYATRYLEENPGDLRGLASLLGHSSLDTLMIYTEPSEETKAARVENM